MANGDTKTNQYLDIAANGTRADLPSDTCCETRTQSLIRGVAERIMDVEDEVEQLENNPDVVDIVATYADLQAYDTSGLTDKDIIRVLEDSTHGNNSTYYRWNATTNQFDFVGEISGGGSSEFTLLTDDDVNWQDPQTGDSYVALWLLPTGHYTTNEDSPNVIISTYEQDGDYLPGDLISVETSPLIIINNNDPGSGVVYPDFMIIDTDHISHYIIDGSTGLIDSAQDYGSPFAGTDGDTPGTEGLVPAPNPADVGKFLSSDGTWQDAGGSSYKTLTEADYNWNSVDKTTTGTLDSIAPWLLDDGIYYVDNTVYVAQTNSFNKATNTVYARKSFMVFKDPELNGISTGILLYSPEHSYTQPLFLPYTNNGSLQVGSVDSGLLLSRGTIQNNLTTTTSNRVLDARQGKALNDKITPSSGASAPTTSTVGELGKIYIDTTNDDAYMCVNVNGSTYTWKKITP